MGVFHKKYERRKARGWRENAVPRSTISPLRFWGFTLVESLIVLAIVGILSGVMFTKFQYTEQSAQIDFDSDTLAGLLYEARALSLAGQRVGSTRPNGGYGVRVDTCPHPPCSFFLFADVDPAQPDPSDHTYSEGGADVVIKTISLSSKVVVSSLTPSNPTSLTFSIPNGDVYVNGAPSVDDVVIELRHVDSGLTRRVRVHPPSGRINSE